MLVFVSVYLNFLYYYFDFSYCYGLGVFFGLYLGRFKFWGVQLFWGGSCFGYSYSWRGRQILFKVLIVKGNKKV